MNPVFFETLQYLDGDLQRVARHQARAEATCGAVLPNLVEGVEALHLPPCGEFRVHVPYDRWGWCWAKTCAIPYVPRQIHTLKIVESSIVYPLKSEDRTAFSSLQQKHPEVDELLITHDGRLTDTTYSNILLGEPGSWVTPCHYLLAGTRRAALLDLGEIRMEELTIHDLRYFRFISLINAMLPPGRLILPVSAIINLPRA